MTVTRLAQPTYTLAKGHDPDANLDFLVRTYDDGTTTVATRPGKDQTHIRWSCEVELTREVIA